MARELIGKHGMAVYADCDSLCTPVDVHKQLKQKNLVKSQGKVIATANSEVSQIAPVLDWNEWLSLCAEEYNISKNPEDYILLPTIICPSDLPNRKGIAFPLKQLLRWNADLHQQVYKGWKGCPTFSDHNNSNLKEARGVVLDVILKQVVGFKGNFHKVFGLAAFDRNKYPEVAYRLLSRDTTTVSMGAYIEYYECSICGAKLQDENGKPKSCKHFPNTKVYQDDGVRYDQETGRVIYRKCNGITPFELSEVGTPAWIVSESPLSIDLQNMTAHE